MTIDVKVTESSTVVALHTDQTEHSVFPFCIGPQIVSLRFALSTIAAYIDVDSIQHVIAHHDNGTRVYTLSDMSRKVLKQLIGPIHADDNLLCFKRAV